MNTSSRWFQVDKDQARIHLSEDIINISKKITIGDYSKQNRLVRFSTLPAQSNKEGIYSTNFYRGSERISVKKNKFALLYKSNP